MKNQKFYLNFKKKKNSESTLKKKVIVPQHD